MLQFGDLFTLNVRWCYTVVSNNRHSLANKVRHDKPFIPGMCCLDSHRTQRK